MKNINETQVKNTASSVPNTKTYILGKEVATKKADSNTNPGESALVIDPDTTGRDTGADKTKVEIFPIEQKIK